VPGKLHQEWPWRSSAFALHLKYSVIGRRGRARHRNRYAAKNAA
jgi:hypothetical protein